MANISNIETEKINGKDAKSGGRTYGMKFDNRIFYYLIIGVILITGAMYVIGILRKPKAVQYPPQTVVLEKIEKKSITPVFEYVGLVEAEESVPLVPRVSGFLEAKNFKGGDFVKQNAVLFEIEPDHYQALLTAAEADEISSKARFSKAQLDFNRISDLYVKKTVPKTEYDAAKAEFEVNKAGLLASQSRLKQASLNLSYASIKAPFDGQISDTPYSVGTLIGPEIGVLATVVTLDPIKVSFGISDKLLSKYKDADISLEAWVPTLIIDGTKYETAGEIIYISPTVNLLTNTIEYKALFRNAKQQLVPGQVVVVSLKNKNETLAIVAPKTAVLTGEGGQRYVFMVEEKEDAEGQKSTHSRKQNITVGEEVAEGFVVLAGLNPGDEIIVQGLTLPTGSLLIPGMPVAIKTIEEIGKMQEEVIGENLEVSAKKTKDSVGENEDATKAVK